MRGFFSGISSRVLSFFGYEEYEEAYETDSYNDRIIDFNSSRPTEIVIGHISSFASAREVTNNLKQKKTVIVNLKDIEREEAKRIIDFICGTTYALNGEMYKVGEAIFMFTPASVKIITEDFDGNAGIVREELKAEGM